MSTDIEGLLERAGITKKMVDAARSAESVFLCYMTYNRLVGNRSVHVEIIAPNLVEVLLRLPVEDQADMIEVMANLVPEVGDHEIIVDDHGNGKKYRGARVIRLRNDHGEKAINLLITR